jgi:hypothetical protein
MSAKVGKNDIIRDGLIVFLDPRDRRNYTLTEVEVLVVAGGGGGGTNGSGNDIAGGGGGGGGVLYSSSYSVTPGSGINVTVGPGGTTAQNTIAGNGTNSVFGNLVAIGGGRGSGYAGGAYYSANSGGSGGGGSYSGNSGGSGTSGQGNRGGNGTNSSNPGRYTGGGGGGAGGPGQHAIIARGIGGDGGPGLPFSIQGTPVYYGGGGGGGCGFQNTSGNIAGKGGIGGGGEGSPCGNGTAGFSNTGGGGGGAGNCQASPYSNAFGGAGGSGIVIVRYPGPQKASGGNSIFVNRNDGYTVHIFTSSGTFTPFSSSVISGTTLYGLQNLVQNKYNAYTINGPQYSTDGGGSVYFNQTSDSMELEFLDLRNSDHTIMAAGRYVTTASGRLISGKFNNWLMGLWGTTTENYYAEGWVTNVASGNSDTNWRIWAATGTTKTDVWKMYVNGSLTFSNNGGVQGPNGISFGRYAPGNSEYSNSQLGVFLVYDRVLSSEEISHNYNVLRGRYGI